MQMVSIEISPHKLRRARGKRKAGEVAQASGISRQHLWLIETGRSKPSAEIIAKLCVLYGVGIHDLVRQSS